jgi:hypothetical protein
MRHRGDIRLWGGIEDIANEKILLIRANREKGIAAVLCDFTHHARTIVISHTKSKPFVISPTNEPLS